MASELSAMKHADDGNDGDGDALVTSAALPPGMCKCEICHDSCQRKKRVSVPENVLFDTVDN